MAILTVEQKCQEYKPFLHSSDASPIYTEKDEETTVWDHYVITEVHDYFDSNIS